MPGTAAVRWRRWCGFNAPAHEIALDSVVATAKMCAAQWGSVSGPRCAHPFPEVSACQLHALPVHECLGKRVQATHICQNRFGPILYL